MRYTKSGKCEKGQSTGRDEIWIVYNCFASRGKVEEHIKAVSYVQEMDFEYMGLVKY